MIVSLGEYRAAFEMSCDLLCSSLSRPLGRRDSAANRTGEGQGEGKVGVHGCAH